MASLGSAPLTQVCPDSELGSGRGASPGSVLAAATSAHRVP